MEYRVVRIPKGNGKHREIYIVSEQDRFFLRSLLPQLEEILAGVDEIQANYAFQAGRNCALHAFQHIGYEYTLSMDLENFFGSVRLDHVKGLIPKDITDICFINGAPQQGLPTSPIISSIAFSSCDKKIVNALKKFGIQARYTRYADDLVFSFDNRKDEAKIRFLVKQVVESEGYTINEKKTKLQSATNGKVVITGIAVDSKGLQATRRTRKKIRAAIHQGNAPSAQGLIEWTKCKFPKSTFD